MVWLLVAQIGLFLTPMTHLEIGWGNLVMQSSDFYAG